MSYKTAITVALVILACIKPSVESHALSEYKVGRSQCLNESLSVWQKPSVSLLDCFVSSRKFQLNSVGVVQRNRQTATCALFRFSQVCHLLSLFNINSTLMSTGLREQVDCEILVDSEYDAITANEHFNAVWVGDRGPALENVVCGSGGQRNPVKSRNVTWTSEGARMDGVSSRLWVEDPVGLNFTGSYTWVLHLKRRSNYHCLLELENCVSKSYVDHFWQYSMKGGISRSLFFRPGQPKRFQTGNVLATNPQQFFIAGVSFDRLAGRCSFFLGSTFLSVTEFSNAENLGFKEAGACIRIGFRNTNEAVLDGVVRAVAVANSALTEDQIRRLFQLLV